ncbi:hypothetical protein [Flavobacterium daemonense]|uniref:hypothetical protein n=1 Tax=Flavobacterium daemonense TaxID=1393049 RepID=UPI001184B8BB|nr:hypothetical protein [Flavobacterium daemonense]KAF2333780.1 hypothetical protein FND99_09935 [Flavobacterium daemonense]
MNKRYKYNESLIRANSKNKYLNASENRNPLLGIFRLLSGTINCTDEFLEKNHKFRTNYFQFPYIDNDVLKQSIFTDLFPEEVKISHLNSYFKVARRNKKFYETIECELIKCLIANKSANFLESFFYLYRVIEGISYSLPLIFASKLKDYNKSYDLLQKFFSKSKESELAFFKKFICEVYKEEDFFKTSISINLDLIDVEELKEKYYKTYSSLIIDKKNIEDATENEEVKISFIGYYEFMIEVRNRYFHFLQGTWKENLKTTEVLYPDQFFKPLIDNGINWVAIILFEILKFDLDS